MKIIKWLYYKKVVQGRISAEEYTPITEDSKFMLDWNEEAMSEEAKSWAETVNPFGLGERGFTYAYAFVDTPPQKWIDEKKAKLKYSIEYSKDLLRALEDIKTQQPCTR